MESLSGPVRRKEKHLHQRGKLSIRKDCFQMLNMDAWQSVHELEDQLRKLPTQNFREKGDDEHKCFKIKKIRRKIRKTQHSCGG